MFDFLKDCVVTFAMSVVGWVVLIGVGALILVSAACCVAVMGVMS